MAEEKRNEESKVDLSIIYDRYISFVVWTAPFYDTIRLAGLMRVGLVYHSWK
jgi:hypothetical protein